MSGKVYNRTELDIEVINNLPKIGRSVNTWMKRDFVLCEHPTNLERLICIGISFDQEMVVVTDDERNTWATALDYIAHGKVYTRD